MASRTITLCYRKIIDARSARPWEKMVFEDSYKEFKMQFQFFDQQKRHTSFAGLLHENPAAAKLHFLVSASVTGYVQQLKEQTPDILNSLGKQFLVFKNFAFEIINSDIKDISRHQVAITFYSELLNWHDTVADQLLVSEAGQSGDQTLTHLVRLQPFLSIFSLIE